MPEYLSPGVFIEEVQSRLKAIEGVSTSTAAFVGPAQRGPVPGYAWPDSEAPGLPFEPTKGFVLTPDPSPVLVTSFADFQRQFGPPLALTTSSADPDSGYLGHAVRAFFDNGGRRCFIARIVSKAATASKLRVHQGVALRLLRSAAKGDKTLYFTSIRGVAPGDTLTFTRHSDGTSPLAAPGPALLTGSGLVKAPFALKDQDAITVTITNGPVPGPLVLPVARVEAKPAKLEMIWTATTPVNLNDTLDIRVGADTEPVQTITFNPAPTAAADVAAALAKSVSGLKAYVDTSGKIVLETDVRGTKARAVVTGGTARAALGLNPTGNTGFNLPSGGNVADVDHVTIDEIRSLLASTDLIVDGDGAGHLRIATRAIGATVQLSLTETSTTGTLLARLGLASSSATGSAGVAPVTVASYNLQENTVTITSVAGLTEPLSASDVWAVSAPSAISSTPSAISPTAVGPLFFARTPGSWSAGVSVSITHADRAAVPIAGKVVTGLKKLPVQSVATFYPGAVIEIDHDGAALSVNQVEDVNPATRVLTLSDPLPKPVSPAGWVRTLEIDITVSDETGAAPTEVYQGLSWNQGPAADVRRHYASVINARSRLVWVQPPDTGTPTLWPPGTEDFHVARQPSTVDGFPMKPLAIDIGLSGLPSASDDATWLGEDKGPGQRSGIESLKDLDEARIIAAPGKTSQTVQLALLAQCEVLRYRFAILDGERDPTAGSLTSILKHRNLYDSSFGAYYQPWMSVTLDGQTRYLPPSGYLAGIYARVDNARGVWKAPANESVFNVTGLRTSFTTGEQDMLNPRGVNLVRRFDQGGIRVWGARTLSSDPDVKYINVRRTLIFLEASIDRGTQWVVFEPNTPDTWSRLTDSLRSFLHVQWRDGALFGASPEEAFFVRCDQTTMTADDILNGRLICHIGVAIVRPAEFVIFRIEQITTFGKQ